MPSKVFDIPGLGPVTCHKSTRSRSIRISVSERGVRVSLPTWTPYAVGVAFARQHHQWIEAEQAKHVTSSLQEGDKIGKLHMLHFEPVPEPGEARTRVTPTKLVVSYKPSETPHSAAVQKRAEQAAVRALRKEASVLLPPRLAALAASHGMTYTSVTVKNLKRRWGSCDSHGALTFNLFLMQLSWQQIDYVICHELAHTKHMNHGQGFWQEVERMMPDARIIAKKVRHIQPALKPMKTATAFDDDMAY